MEIRLLSLLEGARQAEGTVVIIDVYRAFTTAAVAFSRGADKIILVAEIEEALELRRQGKGELCVGEVGGIRPKKVAQDFQGPGTLPKNKLLDEATALLRFPA